MVIEGRAASRRTHKTRARVLERRRVERDITGIVARHPNSCQENDRRLAASEDLPV